MGDRLLLLAEKIIQPADRLWPASSLQRAMKRNASPLVFVLEGVMTFQLFRFIHFTHTLPGED
jgi:hypothetical protein